MCHMDGNVRHIIMFDKGSNRRGSTWLKRRDGVWDIAKEERNESHGKYFGIYLNLFCFWKLEILSYGVKIKCWKRWILWNNYKRLVVVIRNI